MLSFYVLFFKINSFRFIVSFFKIIFVKYVLLSVTIYLFYSSYLITPDNMNQNSFIWLIVVYVTFI